MNTNQYSNHIKERCQASSRINVAGFDPATFTLSRRLEIVA